ncbi:MAG TPA: hypothetical protein DGH68_03705, partial [Bacteroidetes bacterium]|nr:hypothetical protein [Bacteroidota bacterium]
MKSTMLSTIALLMFASHASFSQPASKIYLAQYDDPTHVIYSCNLNGSGLVSMTMPLRPKCIAVDWRNTPQKLYVGLVPTSGNGKIIRCNVDGTNQEDVVTDAIGVNDLELDLDRRKIYWLQNTYNDDRIFHADMDGLNSNITQIYATTVAMRDLWGLALDVRNQRLWITERGSTCYSSYVRRMSFSGAGVAIMRNPVCNPHDIEYYDNKIYWGDDDGLEKANTDGSGIDTLIGGANVYSLSIDGTNNRIYWIDYQDYKLKRVDLDGTNRVVILNVIGYLTGVDTDFNPSAVPVEFSPALPTTFGLMQNYPNPFNPVTSIHFSMADYRLTILKVYDVLG